jgi:serine/threonine protein kinase
MNEEGEFIIEEARSTSFPTSFPSQLPDSFFSHRCEDPTRPDNSESARHDFATLITVLSWLYSRRKYIPFDIVDLNKHETAYKPIATGSTFEVTTTTITHSLPSTTHHDISEEAEVQIVIKQPQGDPDLFDHEGQCVQQQQLKSFLMELLVMDLDDVYDDGNIVRLLGVGWFYNQFTTCPTVQPRLILEHADNTLAGLLSEHTDLTWDFKLRMCLDIANGLDTLHRHDIIHGDLTLSNILVFKSPSEDTGASYYKAKIADFGHSYIEGTRDRPLGGTPDYMAPEIEDRAATDVPKAIDIYALGIILWHLLIESSPAPPRPKPLLIDGLEAQDTDIQDLLRTVRRRHESHTDEMRTFLCQELVRCTIRFLPQKRDLAKAIEVLGKLHRRAQREREQEWEPQSRVPQAPRSTASSNFSIATLPHRLLDNILVDYTSINLASGVFHDQMLQTFSKIAQNTADPRCSRAFWELAVCKMARLGDPDDTKPEDAVPFIIRAAEMGEMVAKGYSKRLLDALDPSSCEGIARSANVEEWLFDAAVHGHEAAYEDWRDLFMRDSDGIDEVMRRRVVHVASPLSFTQDSDHVQSAKSERGKAFVEGNSPSDERATRTAIHWAARYGPPEDLHDTVENLNVSVDLKNEDGDTPLITACEAGNFSSACALLHLGARIDHVNHFNETAMHHLWRFTDIQAASLFHSMSEAPGFSEAFFTEAVLECTRDGRLLRKSGSNPTELDPLPILSGFPIERALGRRRDHLVKTMLQEGPALSPSVGHAANGNLVRRMILWASRLNLTGIRQFLVDFSKDPTQTRPGGESDPGLKKVENSFWTFENSNLDYMCSIAQGWTSSRRSWRTPEHLWRLCIHGRNWRNKLGDSIAAILDNTARPLCCFEKALIHALNLKHYDFLDLFLNTYRSTHASITSTSRHYCIKYTDPQTPSSGFDYLDTPHGTTPIIDRILCRATKDAETNRSTLLQRSVMLGDRRLFSSLVHKSGADILRPWSSYKAGTHGITCPRNPPWSPDQAESSENVVPLFYLNCYSLLAVYSKDVWFA